MAGNAEQLSEIEQCLKGNLKYCIQAGLTHWDAASAKSPLKNTPSEIFFAPGHIQKRIAQWDAKAFEQQSMQYIPTVKVITFQALPNCSVCII